MGVADDVERLHHPGAGEPALDLLAAGVVAGEDEIGVFKSFRNLERTVVLLPSEVEVAAVVWARSLLVTQAALELLQRRAS